MRNYMIKTMLILLVNCIFQVSYSQENFMPGYVIKLDGDTVKGSIDYRNWASNPDKIFFKGESSETLYAYTPTEIRGFRVADELYQSATVEVEVTSDKVNELTTYADLNIEIVTTFLQTVVKGEKGLYAYKNLMGKVQFYYQLDSSYELLIHKRYIKETSSNNIIIENKTYIGQLSTYFQDCRAMMPEINKTRYTKKSLEKMFLSYYNWMDLKPEFHKETEKIKVEYGIMAGMTQTKLNIELDNNYDAGQYDYLIYGGLKPSSKFSAGASVCLLLPRSTRKWAIRNDFLCTSFKMDGIYEKYENENNYKKYFTDLNYTYLKMQNMLQYKLPVGSFYVNANAGISTGVVLNATNSLNIVSKFYDTERSKYLEAFSNARSFELGYVLGLGLGYKNFSAGLKYEAGNGISNSTNMSTPTVRKCFLLGYTF